MKILLALAGVMSLVAVGGAQSHPNFSGTWTLEHVAVDPRMTTRGAPDFLLGSKLIIVQDAPQLTITQLSPRPHAPIAIALDGTESRNAVSDAEAGRLSPLSEFASQARWERDTLVIVTRGAIALEARLSLTPSGQLSIQDVAPNIELNPAVTHLLYSKQ